MLIKARNYSRAVYGMSPLSLFVLLTQGTNAARELLTKTRLAAQRKDLVHIADWWNVARLFSSDKELILHAGHWEEGCTAPLERFILAQLLHFFSPKIVLEVGTFNGSTTCLFLDNLPPESRIFTIDLPLDRKIENISGRTDEHLIRQIKVGSLYNAHPHSKSVTQILGDTMQKATWEKIPGEIELAFIDASHSYEAVKNDTEFVFTKLSENGVIAWHDYTEEETPERGVGKFLRQLMKERDDIFLLKDTSMVLRIPLPILLKQAKEIDSFYPSGNFLHHFPNGPLPWLKNRK